MPQRSGLLPYPDGAILYRKHRKDQPVRRRDFITLLGGAAAWPLAARAQQSERMRRIGVLLSVAESDPEGKAQLSGFTLGLAELGWIEGRNLRMEVRWGGGDVDQIRTFAKELVALQPDLIVAQGTPVTAALQRETRTIPIVFVVVTDPVGDGFVAGLPHSSLLPRRDVLSLLGQTDRPGRRRR
jgi:putative ABC transport system substrate-binding protein